MNIEEQNQYVFPYLDLIQNNIYQPNNKVIVKVSDPRIGLGVFAMQDIEKDELIETCPMIPLSWRSKYHGDTQIHNYCYPNASCDCERCSEDGPITYMVLGYGMLYNHQDEPNTQWDFNFSNLIGNVIATKPIRKNQEIFVSYGSSYFRHRPQVVIEN
jgi:SET domain-containing protein